MDEEHDAGVSTRENTNYLQINSSGSKPSSDNLDGTIKGELGQ